MTHRLRFVSSCLALFAVLALASTSILAQRIVIDPGHGGSDPGGTGTGMEEKEVVLDTGLRFRDLLQADTADEHGGGSWSVSLTRDTDIFVSLAARSAYANSISADRFMSIHANAFGTASANGTETFSYLATGTSANLRNLVQEEMISAWGLTDRGSKTAGFSVLVNTAMPAELHELGFITNVTDASKLASSAARQDAAMAHLRALQRHYGLEAYAPGAAAIGSLLVAVRSDASAAIAGVTVTLDGSETGQTDEAGELLIEDLAVGDHLVTVTAPGFQDGEQTIEVFADDVASVLFELITVPEGEDPGDDSGGGGSTTCDSRQAECTPPPATGVDGGCSTQGSGSGLGLALLVLALMLRASRRTAAARCRRN